MTKELYFIRFLQFSVLALTFILFYSIRLATKGEIKKHKIINSIILSITGIAVTGLLVSIFAFGFDYRTLQTGSALLNIGPEKMTTRLLIHRCFSAPLFFSLIYSTWSGAKKNGQSGHRTAGMISMFFWLGTLITAWLFF